jgi:ABC-2 type transport system ATP-binding protein
MVTVSHVRKTFGTLTALDGISLTVGPGEFFGLLGPNGAGKSTLMNLMVGYLDPDGGEIRIGGEKVTRDNLQSRRQLGLVPQSLALYEEISARENLEIFGSFYQPDRRVLDERIREQLNAVQLYDRRNDKVQTFSGGMKRRLNLVASLLHDPPLLLCDEPTVGVDPQSRNAIFDYLEMLNRRGKTIVYTTHYMEEVERMCSRIAIMDAGRIIAGGTLGELLEKSPQDSSVVIQKHPSTLAEIASLKLLGDLVEQDGQFVFTPRDGSRLSSVYAWAERSGISYSRIHTPKRTLEALFLELTGRSLRD